LRFSAFEFHFFLAIPQKPFDHEPCRFTVTAFDYLAAIAQ